MHALAYCVPFNLLIQMAISILALFITFAVLDYITWKKRSRRVSEMLKRFED